jgi:hypothetical protein
MAMNRITCHTVANVIAPVLNANLAAKKHAKILTNQNIRNPMLVLLSSNKEYDVCYFSFIEPVFKDKANSNN